MPPVSRYKTYKKTQKTNILNYSSTSSTSQNSFLFPITGASIAIDSLLAKNIEKRNSSLKESNKVKTRTGVANGHGKKPKKEDVRLLDNDSFDLSINTTFEKLLQTSGNNSLNLKDKPLIKVQKTYERRVKTDALSLGKKIKNNKTDKKNLLQLAKKVQKTPEMQISPESSVLVARKFTPIASTSKIIASKVNSFQPGLRHCMQAQNSPSVLAASTPIIPRHLRSREDLSLSPITAKKQIDFKEGWKSLFESDINKNASLPKDSVILINSTLNDASQIIHKRMPLFQSDKSRIENVPNKIRNDLKFKAIPIVIIEDGMQPNNNNNNKRSVEEIYSPRVNLTRNSFSKYRNKIDELELLQSPYINLTRYSFSEYINKKQKHSNVSTIKIMNVSSDNNTSSKMSLRPKSPIKNIVKRSTKRKKTKVVVQGVGLRTRSQLKTNCDTDTDTVNICESNEAPRRARTMSVKTKSNINTKENSPDKPVRKLRSNSVQLDKINDSIDSSKRVLRSQTTSLDGSKINNNSNNKELIDSKISEINKDESIFIAEIMEQLKKPLKTDIPVNIPVRRSSRARRKSVLIDEENYSDWGEYQRITQNKIIQTPQKMERRQTRSTSLSNFSSIINISDYSKKSLFSPASTTNLDVIENTVNKTSTPKKCIKKDDFVTRRRGTSKSFEAEDLNSQTISLHEWERFSQNKISSIKIDDVDPVQIQPPINQIGDNCEEIINNSVISDTFTEEDPQNIFLKPGKQWFRSLSILRRTNIHNIQLNNSYKGRKWRESVCAVFDKQQQQQNRSSSSGGVLIHTSDNQHNEIFNITAKNLHISRLKSFSRRTTLQIVPITTKKEVSVCRVNSILEDCETNNTGYVSTLADESQSILASFDKLSLTTNVEEREETARQIILKRCGQTQPLLFDDCYSQRLLTRCRKIGEGVYGEVFMYKSLDRQCRVMKIIPIEGNLVVNGEHQKKFEEIISEIIIASELSNLRNNKEFSTNGFNELLKICCVQGKYPQHLLDLWNLYDEEQGSENDSPEIFTDEQLYIVLELANGGQDLEAYRFNNAEQSFAVFAQVVCSLAVAESALQFEHRDMHWGNLLISPTNETTTTFRLNGRELEIATKGVNVSIIDFTLSRMTYNNCCIFNDLALDPDLFTATGDYQFDIYRLMRKRNQDDWQRFEPYSNILWLDYTLDKMITQLRYLRINTKTHKTNIRRLTQMRKKIFNYNSATELLNSDAFSQVFLY